MGLVPKMDSPHYHKAKVISQTEFTCEIDNEVMYYFRLSEHSTGMAITTDTRLTALWKDRTQYCRFYIYTNNEVYFPCGLVFNEKSCKSFILQVRSLNNVDVVIPLLELDIFGEILNINDFKYLAIVKDPIKHTYNPSQLTLQDILIYRGDLSIRLSDSASIKFNLYKENAAIITLDANLSAVSLISYLVRDTLSNNLYNFRAQVPYSLYENEADNFHVYRLIDESFQKELPDYFEKTACYYTNHFAGCAVKKSSLEAHPGGSIGGHTGPPL